MEIFIDGEAGTTGLQLRTRLEAEPGVHIQAIDPAQRKNRTARAEALNSADIAVLCLPADAAAEAVSLIDNPSVRILDASTAHRTAKGWIWGMAEWDADHPARIAKAARVSNPGCYAVGAVALLRPLTAAGILSAETRIRISAISGYTGGGRQMIETYENPSDPAYTESPATAYALDLAHKHIEEIRRHSGLMAQPLFTPLVGRFRQGMLVIVPLFAQEVKGGAAAVEKTLQDWYRGSALISYCGAPAERLDAAALAGSDRMEIYCARRDEQIMLLARLDNLGKGAAGAAVQNIRLMMGRG